MKKNWMLLVVIYHGSVSVSSPSIVGVTYRDNFDFEERYKDIHECDPFYWHPLHLPEMCANMFEKLIRSKIAKHGSSRIMRERGPYEDMYPSLDYAPYTRNVANSPNEDYPSYDIGTADYGERRTLTPYEKMLEQLKKDVEKDPSLPRLGMHPNFGPVAIYNQEISKKSETMIKEVATAYAKIGQESYANFVGYNDSPDPQLYIWNSDKNNTEKVKNNEKTDKAGNRKSRTKTNVGGVITIVETLEPRRNRRNVFSFKEKITKR